MRITLKTTLLAAFALVCLSETSKLYAQAGGSSVPFLLISPDARSSGMGETGTAIADDINAIYWNPAGLGFLDYFPPTGDEEEGEPFRQVALSFSPWLPQFNSDLFYSYGTIGQFFPSLDGTVAFNFIFMNLGEFTRTWDDGRVLGKFNSHEFAVGLSYGTIIAPDLAWGFQLRYIQSDLSPATAGNDAGVGISGGFDMGLLWKPQDLPYVGDALSVGLNLQNVGPKITYKSESDPLPTNLRLGAAYTLVKDEFNDLKVSADVSKLLVRRDSAGPDVIPKSLVTAWENPGVELGMGAEYWYQGVVAFRAGYFTEPSTLGNRKYWNFGAGLKYDIFKVDMSFINTIEENHPLANTMRFSLLIDWR
ncbi:MAG: PorV/PorQ family protein [Chloroflexota bacterium]